MTNVPKLSITIPTYNRRRYLEQTLDVLLPQINDDVEVIIFDNCSTDDTEEYLDNLPAEVKHIRQDTNVGPDRNMISCMTEAHGRYVWLLCDDDLPCSNTVQEILEAIDTYSKAPMLYLRARGDDENVSGYDSTPVETGWTEYDSEGFLTEISYQFTFAPSIVVRRDCLDLPFIKQRVGSWLVPGAITLSTIGEHGGAVVSNEPLLYARGNNSGGYNAFVVFTKNILDLFRVCQPGWFTARVLHETYNANLRVVVPLIIRNWNVNLKGLITLLRFGYGYSAFYSTILPLITKRALRRVIRRRG